MELWAPTYNYLITGRVSLCGVVVLDALGGLDEHLNVKSWMVFH